MKTKTPIDDFLKPYENDPEKLTADMNALAETHAGLWLIAELSRRCDGGEASNQITAEGIRMLAFGLGFRYVEHFGKWAKMIGGGNPAQLLEWLGLNQRPVMAMLDYKDSPDITATHILTSTKQHMITSDAIIGAEWSIKYDSRFDDVIYKTINIVAFKEVLTKAPLPYRGYEPEKADCDDYARCVRGYLSRWGVGNYAIGAAGIVFLDDQDRIVANHVVILAVLTDGTTIMADPQTRSIVPNNYNRGGIEVRNAIIETRF